MKKFLAEQSKFIILTGLAILWIFVFPIWCKWVTINPLDIPISLNPAGSFEKKIKLNIPERYSLNLIFERGNVPFKELKNLIGSSGICKIGEVCSKGISVPVRWSLHDINTGNRILSGEVESLDANGWSAKEIDRHLGNIQTTPGNYIFRAEILRSIPALAHIKARIAIQIRPKSSSTWQMGLVWWGSIATYVLVWPFFLYSVVILIWQLVLTIRANRRQETP